MTKTGLLVVKGEADAPEPPEGTRLSCPVTLQRYSGGKLAFQEGMVAVESDLRLRVNGADCAVLTRTPGDDMALVVGYLFSRSMIRECGDVAGCSFHHFGPSRADVELGPGSRIRRLYPSPKPVHVAPELILQLRQTFEARQNLYKNTRATHAAALFAVDGDMVAFGEDVGRHNAFDKAVGRALLEGTLQNASIAMLSSRLALELTMKASTAGIPILCGFSSPTSSGVNYAERNNITLIGRVWDEGFNVYANGWRLLGS